MRYGEEAGLLPYICISASSNRQTVTLVIVYNYFMLLCFCGQQSNYCPRCCGQPYALSPEVARPRAIVDRLLTVLRVVELTVVSKRHDTVVLLPNQCNSKVTLCQEAVIYV